MPGGAAEAISAKRAELAGDRVGWRGLISSKKTFGIALFASLGGFVYGCETTLRSNECELTFFRQPGNVCANPDHVFLYQSRTDIRPLLFDTNLTDTRPKDTLQNPAPRKAC